MTSNRKGLAVFGLSFAAAAWFIGFMFLASTVAGALGPICVVVALVGMVPFLRKAHEIRGGHQPYPPKDL